jgi:hypothetical protein
MVNATLAWPRRSLTTLTGTPSMISSEAWVWRRSWNRIRGELGHRPLEAVEELADRLGVHEPSGGVDEHPVVGVVG